MERIFTYEALPETARLFWEKFSAATVFAFDGQMGAGKTTFIKALCAAKQVADVTSSPTFSIINEYHYASPAGHDQCIYHLDLYRLRNEQEALDAGVEDCLYSGGICFVEWPGIIANLLPPDTVLVQLEAMPDQKRLLRAGPAFRK
ncbi:tRNA threonylcarbamoyladenosine biosynthesis protein TsaE [Chitinophaga costaii]|uniref:tRNA threonylcarbamoyladenosine biosynthesis protein TsaE n=1 Tax=Chitinophaga costaii TaxID=1335309 RepID=A0A1C4F3F5_9BACT|nr:tRNA (adenosine(37)-N6)-threonylcarbamoyltransferase complex ATPase subunit type 1 TsaE [Chitinophaga costaii]PUZ22100.1 tRNA (adenosine(37)-N6)-threonylcarbamoyltransferase complex ATPase subunit type 1 TsaE [Chitinophaga costaii]SCC50384.1 tRNA threonylcarbamoyladenosine biosynthesis protein TsaE [Chitinophaga costaii]